MLLYGSTLIIAFSITIFAIPVLFRVAVKIGLLDQPDHRKLHEGGIPLIGGLAIFFGMALAIVFSQKLSSQIVFFLTSASLIVVLGVIDDLYQVSAFSRLVVELVVTLILCLGTGLHIQSFGDLLGFGEVLLGFVGYLVTGLAVVAAINAYNMIDGIDGLVGASAIVSFTALSFLFYYSGHQENLMLSVTFIVALLPYLAANLSIPPIKIKIFMGDAGSMLIGLTVAWLLLQGSQGKVVGGVDSFRPVAALWIIAIPLMDMVAIMLRRYKQGKLVFAADRSHLHHLLMQNGLTSKQTLLFIVLLTVITSGIGVAGEMIMIPEVVMFAGFIILFFTYILLMNKYGELDK